MSLLNSGSEPSYGMVGLQPEQLLAQPQVALQRRGARARGLDQRLDHLARHRVAVERGVERGRKVARLRDEPVALQHAVVQRGIGVRGARVGADVGLRRLRAIGLVAVVLEQRVVVAGRQRDAAAVGQRDGRELHVRGAQLAIGLARRVAEAAGERQQPLALFVERVRRTAVGIEDRKAIRRQRRRLLEPALHRRPCGTVNSSGVNHAVAVSNFENNAVDALEAPRHGLVARVDVALQLRVAVQPVLQLADLVERQVGLQHRGRAVLQRALERRERGDLGLHLAHAGFPGIPVRIDRAEVPAELRRDVAAVARRMGSGSEASGQRQRRSAQP